MTEKPGLPRGGTAVHGVHRSNEPDGDVPVGRGIAWRVHLARAVLLGVPVLLALAIGHLIAPPTGLADAVSAFLLFAAAGNLALLGIVLCRLREPLERAPRPRSIGAAAAALQRARARHDAPSDRSPAAALTAREASGSVTLSRRSARRKWRRRRPPARDVTLERATRPDRPLAAVPNPGDGGDAAERLRERSGPRRGAPPASVRRGAVVRIAPTTRASEPPTADDRRPPQRVRRRVAGVATRACGDVEHGPER